MSSITDRAARAAAERDAENEASEENVKLPPTGKDWDNFEASATKKLTTLLGEDPGPCQRLEPRSWRMNNLAHAYPEQLKRTRLCVYYPDSHEVAVTVRLNAFAIRRANNPNEEAQAAEIRTLADFGEAFA